MAINFSIEDVRNKSGAPSDTVNNGTITGLIKTAVEQTKAEYGIELEPSKTIETLEGDWKNKILVDEYFPLKVLKIINGNSEMDLTNIYTNSNEGTLQIYGDSITSNFASRFSGYNLQVKVKYIFGAVEKDNKSQTESTSAVLAGANIVVPVEKSSFFMAGDYVFIEDMNNAKELAKIVDIPDSTSMILDLLNNPYEEEALITNSKTMEIFNQFILYESALAVAVNAIGITATVNSSASLGSLATTKGIPWTHWEHNYQNNVKARDKIALRIKNLLGTFV